MQGILPVTGKMPVPQVLLLKDQHYRYYNEVFSPLQRTLAIRQGF
jgi:hypothetical protein